MGMKEYIIKVDEDKKDIMGNMPLIEKPQELVRCKDCKFREECMEKAMYDPEWYCADGVRKEW